LIQLVNWKRRCSLDERQRIVSSMPKNLALFIDGTGNKGPRDKPLKKDSNVYKLYQLCKEPQKLYQAGVGSHRFDVLGGIGGFGTKKRLREAYRFVTDNYQSGDSIYIFGFSRGAFAARLFSGFLGYVGSLFGKPPFEDYLPHVYRIYESSVVLDVVDEFRRYLARIDERTEPIPIHFVGAFDTVERYFPVRDLPEIETLPKHITHARHALAIHERRREMEPTLWKKWASSQTVKQVWFPGAHSDVGGGYPEMRLANAPLRWVGSEAASYGLKLSSLPLPSGKKILHQQRTNSKVIGQALAIKEGEGPRKALQTTNPTLIGSMDMDAIARDHLGPNPIPAGDFHFSNFPVYAKPKALKELEVVDHQARKLLQKIDAGKSPTP